MSAPRKTRARLVAIGLALATLTATFNQAASTTAAPAPLPTPLVTQTVPQTQPPAAPLTAADRALLVHIENLVQLGSTTGNDAAIHRKLDDIVAAIRNGANPHIPAGSVPGSVFNFMVVAANEMQRPDIIQSIINTGADIHTADQRGLRPIDYAVLNLTTAQRITRTRIDTAITIMQMLEARGAVITDIRLFPYVNVKTHKDLAINIVGMAALRDAGLATQADYDAALNGPARLADMARNLTDLTLAFLRANGAVMIEYPDAAPGGPEPVRITANDTWQSIARRFMTAMNAPDEATALQRIVENNNATLTANNTPSRALTVGETILVPLPPTVSIGAIARPASRTMLQIAQHLQPLYHIPNATTDDILNDLARINGVTRAQIDNMPADTPFLAPFKNDSYTHMQPLTPPPWAKQGTGRTYLIIIESNDYHAKQTYRVAMGTNYGINRDVDFSQFMNWDGMLISYPQGHTQYTPSDAQHILMNLENNPLRNRIIFSHSMGITLARLNPDATRNDKPHDLVTIESIRHYLQRQERSRPIIFNAAGNEYPGAARNVPPFLTSHSPRTINVGAVGRYPFPSLGQGQNIITPYSTMGGELCTLLPNEYGKQMEGTSFTTPLLAGAFRQFVEWYGDHLSYEEIMAAGMLTATRNLLDLDPVNGYYRNTPQGVRAVPALFRTNAAGLPYSERCGPGLANFEDWNEKLKLMVALKQATPSAQNMDLQSNWLPADQAHSTRTLPNGETEYTYRIRVPQNLTLGRLTFFVPQFAGAHSEVTIKTPGGFEILLPRSMYDTVSTHAFAYEDVRAGQFIELRTTKPLADTAALMLRGHQHGNAIQLLRNHLQANGALASPLSTYAGETKVPSYAPPSPPIPPSNDNKASTPAILPGNRIVTPIPMPTVRPQ